MGPVQKGADRISIVTLVAGLRAGMTGVRGFREPAPTAPGRSHPYIPCRLQRAGLDRSVKDDALASPRGGGPQGRVGGVT